MWGKGNKSYMRSDWWIRRIRSWNVGRLKSAADELAQRTIATDFRALDNNPYPLAVEPSLRAAE
jgi:hypothetical protein